MHFIFTCEEKLLSVSKLTSSGNYILFSPQYVKVYQDLTTSWTLIIEGKMLKLVYVLSTECAYLDNNRKIKTIDLWHARLGHVRYHKMKVMMNKSMLKSLP